MKKLIQKYWFVVVLYVIGGMFLDSWRLYFGVCFLIWAWSHGEYIMECAKENHND